MDYFNYHNGVLYAEDVNLTSLADTYGTPCYIYSRATLERHWHAFDQVLADRPHLICYAVKANSNLAVLNVLAQLGSGFDIVSGGELERVLAAGGSADKIVFSGVGKTAEEMQRALLANIHCFNVESTPELLRLNQVAGTMGKTAPVSIRVNPDVDPQTHPYISTGLLESKFGIDINEATDTYAQAVALPNIRVVGVDCHIGSQLTAVEPFVDALQRVLCLLENLKKQGIELRHINIGGGLGVRYADENPPSPTDYAQALTQALGRVSYQVILEPGRAIAANAGILLTRVEYLKRNSVGKNFAIVDAAMNDLIRPALYQAWQAIVPVQPRTGTTQPYEIVGPVCETGDFLGKSRELCLEEGDLLAIRSAGAYGFVMSSNYNTRPRVAELMVDGAETHVVRQREQIAELYRLERVLS